MNDIFDVLTDQMMINAILIALVVLLTMGLFIVAKCVYKNKKSSNNKIKKFEDKLPQFGDDVNAGLNSLQKEINELHREINGLKSRLNSLENNNSLLQRAKENVVSEEPLTAIAKTPIPLVPVKKPYEDFVNAFNKWRQEFGFKSTNDSRQARNNFWQDYAIKGVDCSNMEAKRHDENLPPEFNVAESPNNAYYWGYQLSDGSYAVVPNLRSYEMSVHFTAGFKEVYARSNYEGGKVYNGIKVIEPAIFSTDLHTCLKSGELKLSAR